MRLPAREPRGQALGEIGPDVEPAVARAAAKPLDRAADGKVDAERAHVERNDAGRLVTIEDHERADLVCPPDDRLDVLDLPGLEQDVTDRDEERALVDRVDDRRRPRRRRPRDRAAPGRGTAPRGNCRARRRPGCAMGRPGGTTRTTASATVTFWCITVVPAAHRRSARPGRLPSAAAPTSLRPRPGFRAHSTCGRTRQAAPRPARHRGERVVDQVRRVRQDRKLGAVVEELAHHQSVGRGLLCSERAQKSVGCAPLCTVGTWCSMDWTKSSPTKTWPNRSISTRQRRTSRVSSTVLPPARRS